MSLGHIPAEIRTARGLASCDLANLLLASKNRLQRVSSGNHPRQSRSTHPPVVRLLRTRKGVNCEKALL